MSRLTAIHVLVVVAVLEVAINRVAVPMLRPVGAAPPTWHTVLDYAGLFLFYFAGALAAAVLIARGIGQLRAPQDRRDAIAHAAVIATAALAAIPLVVVVPSGVTLALELAFAVAVLALVVSAYGRGRDLGAQLALPLLALPLLLHVVAAIGGELVWPARTFDGPGPALARAGLACLCLAALVTPYGFAPRPFTRAVTRPIPVLVAMIVAAVGAVLTRTWYPVAAEIAGLAVGVDVAQGAPDPRLALYLLAIATFAWTLASNALAASPARRQIGAGLALIVLGGYAFKWPHHYLLPLLGIALIADATRRVRDEELDALPLVAEAPPVSDAAWSTYTAALATALRRVLADVHSLTMRGDAGLTSTVIVGERDGRTVRTRIERIDGCVLALDVVIGREIDEARAATLTLWANPERGAGANPPGPPATPALRSGDAQFDARFRIRGSAPVLAQVFDDGLRARAVATLDGWLALWDGESVRYRVYPGRGAPLDHPLPLSDLALGKQPATGERFVAVIELLCELAARGLPALTVATAAVRSEPADEPTALT